MQFPLHQPNNQPNNQPSSGEATGALASDLGGEYWLSAYNKGWEDSQHELQAKLPKLLQLAGLDATSSIWLLLVLFGKPSVGDATT